MKRISWLLIILLFSAARGFARGRSSGGSDMESPHSYVQIDAGGKKLALWKGGGVSGVLDNTLRGGS